MDRVKAIGQSGSFPAVDSLITTFCSEVHPHCVGCQMVLDVSTYLPWIAWMKQWLMRGASIGEFLFFIRRVVFVAYNYFSCKYNRQVFIQMGLTIFSNLGSSFV